MTFLRQALPKSGGLKRLSKPWILITVRWENLTFNDHGWIPAIADMALLPQGREGDNFAINGRITCMLLNRAPKWLNQLWNHIPWSEVLGGRLTVYYYPTNGEGLVSSNTCMRLSFRRLNRVICILQPLHMDGSCSFYLCTYISTRLSLIHKAVYIWRHVMWAYFLAR